MGFTNNEQDVSIATIRHKFVLFQKYGKENILQNKKDKFCPVDKANNMNYGPNKIRQLCYAFNGSHFVTIHLAGFNSTVKIIQQP